MSSPLPLNTTYPASKSQALPKSKQIHCAHHHLDAPNIPCRRRQTERHQQGTLTDSPTTSQAKSGTKLAPASPPTPHARSRPPAPSDSRELHATTTPSPPPTTTINQPTPKTHKGTPKTLTLIPAAISIFATSTDPIIQSSYNTSHKDLHTTKYHTKLT